MYFLFELQRSVQADGILTSDAVQHHTIKCKNAYKNIFKITEYRSNRLRRIAKPGWSSILSGIIGMKLKLPCCLSWKVCNVRMKDVRCVGSCRAADCKMEIECIASKKKLKITVLNYNPIYEHNSGLKRKILSAERAHYESLLRGRTAFEVRSELADDLMEPHDKEPPTLPSSNALRKIKHRADVPKQNVITGLLELKKAHPNSIGDIGLDPFFIRYSTELQRACYKVESFHRKPSISIDATGPGMID